MAFLNKEAVIKTISFVSIYLVVIGIHSFLIKFIWNWIIPSLFSLREITFFEALGLYFLTYILFGTKTKVPGVNDG